ncbi:MAG: ATP-binding cassette domain-containing protein [Methanomassiliicoccales archaeon]|jgi:cobalt/nickel transport system ATP-binding protein
MTDQLILRTKGLDFSYPNGTLALKNVSIDVEKGKKIVLLGPNGAGKSTLFLHFNGILRPKRGEVAFEGAPLKYDQRSLATLREQVAIVLQNPDDQIFSTTVEEDVAFGPMNLMLEKEEVDRRIDEALHLVGMEDLRQRPTHQLSFGQRKRVSLAGALAMKPKVLIMDEPTAGLDSEMVHELMELSDELNHSGMTMLMSTHDIETAYEWADEMMVMHKGELLFSGSPEDLFADDELIDKLRIVPPFPVRLNQQSYYRTGRPELPFPRNLVEVSQKCFPIRNRSAENGSQGTHDGTGGTGPTDPPVGTMYIVDVEDREYPEQVRLLSNHLENLHLSSGAYGAKARRLVRAGKIDVHNPFHALENAFLRVSLGKDYVLYTDTSLISLVGYNLSKVEQKVGLRINVLFCSHMRLEDKFGAKAPVEMSRTSAK